MEVLKKIPVPAEKDYTVKQLTSMIDKNKVTFDSCRQRNEVWDVERASLFIVSLIEEYKITPMLCCSEDGFELSFLDGQQRTKVGSYYFVKGKYALSKDMPVIETDEGPVEIAGKHFDQLPKDFQDLILNTKFKVWYFEGELTDDQKDEIYSRYNNGQPLTAIELNIARVPRKVLYTIRDISKLDYFEKVLNDNHRNKNIPFDIIEKAALLLNRKIDNPASRRMQTVQLTMKISEAEEKMLRDIFTCLNETYNTIAPDRPKMLGQLYQRVTHIYPLLFVIKEAISEGKNADFVTGFINQFFSPDNGIGFSISALYNEYAAHGTNNPNKFDTRLNLMRKSMDIYANGITGEAHIKALNSYEGELLEAIKQHEEEEREKAAQKEAEKLAKQKANADKAAKKAADAVKRMAAMKLAEATASDPVVAPKTAKLVMKIADTAPAPTPMPSPHLALPVPPANAKKDDTYSKAAANAAKSFVSSSPAGETAKPTASAPVVTDAKPNDTAKVPADPKVAATKTNAADLKTSASNSQTTAKAGTDPKRPAAVKPLVSVAASSADGGLEDNLDEWEQDEKNVGKKKKGA